MRRWLPWIAVAIALQAIAIGVYLTSAPSAQSEGDRGFRPITPQAWSQMDAELVGEMGVIAPRPGRPAIFHFWATWCAPCREELPRVLALASSMQDVDVWCIATDANWEAVSGYFKGRVPSAVVRDVGGRLSQRLGVSELPDSYLVDEHGRVHARSLGPRRWDVVALRAELAEGRR